MLTSDRRITLVGQWCGDPAAGPGWRGRRAPRSSRPWRVRCHRRRPHSGPVIPRRRRGRPRRPSRWSETPAVVPADPALTTDALSNKPLDELNRNSPLQPVYYDYDSADVEQ